jgi:hypothetical protein
MSSDPDSVPLRAMHVRNPWLYVEGAHELVDTRERAGRRIRRRPAVVAPPPPPPDAPGETDDAGTPVVEFHWVLEPEYDIFGGDDFEMD